REGNCASCPSLVNVKKKATSPDRQAGGDGERFSNALGFPESLDFLFNPPQIMEDGEEGSEACNAESEVLSSLPNKSSHTETHQDRHYDNIYVSAHHFLPKEYKRNFS